MILAPGDSFLQGFTGSAGPEDEFVTGSFLIDQIFYQRSVGFAEFRPVAVAKGSIKVYGDDLICCCILTGLLFFRLCIKPCFMCLRVLQFSGDVVKLSVFYKLCSSLMEVEAYPVFNALCVNIFYP